MPRSKVHDDFRTQTCGRVLCSAGLCSPLLPSRPTLALPRADVLGCSRMSSVSRSSWTYAEISTSPHLTTIIPGWLNKSLAFPVFQETIRLLKLYGWTGIHLNSCEWAEGTLVSDSYFWCHDWLTGTVDGEQAAMAAVAVSKQRHPSFGWLHTSSVRADQIPPSKVTAVLEK